MYESQEEEIRLEDYIRVIWKRKWIIILSTLISTLSAIIATLHMPPIYQSSTTIKIGGATSSKMGEGGLSNLMNFAPPNPVDAEIEVLKSRTLGEKVAQRFNLHISIDKKEGFFERWFRKNDDFLKLDSIEVRPDYEGKGLILRITERDQAFELFNEGGKSLGRGRKGKSFKGDGISFLPFEIKGRKGREFILTLRNIHDAGMDFCTRVKIEKVKGAGEAGMLRIILEDKDPEMARDLANGLVNQYLEDSLKRKTSQASQALDFIEDQLKMLSKNLTRAEKRLENYKSGKGIVILSAEAEALIDKVSDLEKAQSTILIQREQVKGIYEALEKGKDIKDFGLSTLGIEDPILIQLCSRLSDLRIRLATTFKAGFTSSSKEVEMLMAEIEETKKGILTSLKNILNTLDNRYSSVQMIKDRYEGEIKDLPVEERHYAILERDARVNEKIFTFLMEGAEELKVSKASTISEIHVIDPAINTKSPIKPKKRLNCLLALVVGLFMGTFMAFFLEYIDRTVKDPDIIDKRLNCPVYGVIPFIGKKALFPANQGIEERPLPILINDENRVSHMFEGYKKLWTNLRYSSVDKKPKGIIITSPLPGEGKSTTVANLAIAYGFVGSRVLLVDSDMRKPIIHRLFNHSQKPGLSDILVEGVPWQEALHNTPIENFKIITSGTIPPDPSQILSSQRMEEIYRQWEESFDIILFDTPPIIPVTDALILAHLVQNLLMVVRFGVTLEKALIQAKASIDRLKLNVLGIVINAYPLEMDGYYGYYYGKDGREMDIVKRIWKRLGNLSKKL